MRRLCWCRCKGGSALGGSFHLVVCGSARVLLERTHAQSERGGSSFCGIKQFWIRGCPLAHALSNAKARNGFLAAELTTDN